MAKESCPGSREIREPYPEELLCRHCGAKAEIWSDEPETTCAACGKTVSRQMGYSCVLWCPAAKQCVGQEKYDRLIRAAKGKPG